MRWFRNISLEFLPSATKLRRLCFHRRVSVHRGGLPQCMLGRKHPPGKDASVHAGKEAPPIWEGCLSACWEGSTPPRKDALVHAGKEAPPPRPKMADAADGTHPTGMHSC